MTDDRRHAPRFLFLQGPPSPFFASLGRALSRRGFAVRRINFSAGDRLFWRLSGALDYRGDLLGWPAFLEARLTQWDISDIVLFGDCRPLHRAAIAAATECGVTVHVVEEGYLRPDWITIATGGVNGHSLLPRDPDWFRAQAASLPPARAAIRVSDLFWRRAAGQIAYHAASRLFRRSFPGYRTHLDQSPARIAGGWARRFMRAPLACHRSRRALRELQGRPYFLFPLQLASDSQVRCHAPFRDLTDALAHVCRSFALHAPADSCLVIKEHPLDPGLTDWRRLAAAIAAERRIADRILYVRDESRAALLRGCAGLLTLNSTMGLLALREAVPTIALGTAIYDMPALTFQLGLDRFWREATPPDPALVEAFRRVILDRSQINGGLYSAAGIGLAVAGAVERLTAASALELFYQAEEIDRAPMFDEIAALHAEDVG